MKREKKKKIPPPVLFLSCLLLMGLLRWIWPGKVFLNYPDNLVGLVPLLAGLATGGSGVFRFRRERTNIHPFRKADKLVTAGVYRYGRNPMYLGLALVLSGAWLLFGAITPILGLFIFVVVIDRWYIPPEERMLGEQFGAAYEEYRSTVRRWV